MTIEESDRQGFRTEGLERDPHSLIGSYFITLTDADLPDMQGVVVASLPDGLWLCEMFDWIVGASSHQQLFRIEQMMRWRFYDDPEWLQNDYQYNLEPRAAAAQKSEPR